MFEFAFGVFFFVNDVALTKIGLFYGFLFCLFFWGVGLLPAANPSMVAIYHVTMCLCLLFYHEVFTPKSQKAFC